jgi:hypothetical protein
VVADFSANASMYLRKGWKTFLRSKNIPEGRTIFFSYDGDKTLIARRFFDSDGDRVGCCFESPNNSDEEVHFEEQGASDEEVSSEDD